MKRKPFFTSRSAIFSGLTLLAAVNSANATDYYWNQNSTTAGWGIGGTWDTSSSAVFTAAPEDALGTAVAATTGTADTLFIGSATTGFSGGTITVTGNQSIGSIITGSANSTAGVSFAGGTLTFAASGTVTNNSAQGLVIDSIIAGAGTRLDLNANGGDITLSSSTSAYAGITYINSGTVVSNNASSLGASGTDANRTVIASGARLVFNNTPRTYTERFEIAGAGVGGTTGALVNTGSRATTLSGQVTLSANATAFSDSGTLTFGGGIVLGSNALTFNSAGTTTVQTTGISGSGGSVLKTGAGTLNLNVATSTYDGGTSITAGTLSFVSGALGTTGNITVNGGTLRWGTSNTQDISSRLVLQNSGNATFDTNGNNVSLGAFGSSASSSVTKAGAGILTFTGSNTYSGTTTINSGGTLRVGNNGTTGTLGSGNVVNNGTLSFHRTDTSTFSGTMTGTGTLAVARGGTLTLASGANVTQTHLNAGDGSAASLGAGTFTVQSGASLTVSGNFYLSNQNNGSGTFNQTGGTVNLTSSAAPGAGTGDIRIGHWSSTTGGTYNLSGGTLNALNADSTVGWDSSGTLAVSGGTANLRGVKLSTGNKSQLATINLSGTGILNIGAGGIYDGSTGANPMAINFSGGTLGALTAWSSSLGITLTNTTTIDTTGGNIGLSGALASTGGISKAGNGTLTLSTTNTYSGNTTIKAGTLALAASGTFANSPVITVGDTGSSGTVLDLTAKTAFSFGSGQTVKGIGTINIGTGKSVTVAGILAPGNSIGTISETGSLILTGTLQTELGTAGATPALGLSDRTAVSENITLSGSTLQLINNSGADGNGSAGVGAYRIMTYGGTRTGTFATITNPMSATLHEKVIYGPASGGGNVDLELYRLATGSTSNVNLGKVRAGGSLTGNLTTTNTATADGFSEKLNATVGSNAGDVNASSGSVSGVIAGANTSTISVGLDTSTIGAKSGSVLVSYNSDGTGTSGYGTTANGSQNVTVNGEVYGLASANLSQTLGPAITGTAPTYTLDFGTGLSLNTLYTASFSIQNGAVVNSFIDSLTGDYGLTGAPEFGTSAVDFSGLAAGAAASLFNITFYTTSTGTFLGTFNFDGTSVQSGLSDVSVGDFNIALSATAIPEPRAALLGGLGMLALLRRRRN